MPDSWPTDAPKFKDYILPLIFLKRVGCHSLTWQTLLESGGFMVGDEVKIAIEVSAVRERGDDGA